MINTELKITYETAGEHNTHSLVFSLSHHTNEDGIVSATLIAKYTGQSAGGNDIIESSEMYFNDHAIRAIVLYLESRSRPD